MLFYKNEVVPIVHYHRNMFGDNANYFCYVNSKICYYGLCITIDRHQYRNTTFVKRNSINNYDYFRVERTFFFYEYYYIFNPKKFTRYTGGHSYSTRSSYDKIYYYLPTYIALFVVV